jgi:hypothetical protein
MNNRIVNITPLQAIRAKCKECASGHPSLVRKCEMLDCSLYPYRFGKNPNRSGIGFARRSLCAKSLTQREFSQ